MKTEKFTSAQIIKALEQADGVQASAAIALKTSRKTISNYIHKHPDIAEAYEAINETTIDRVESKLLEACAKGNIVAIIFYLKTKAKHRGYVEKSEVTLSSDSLDQLLDYLPDDLLGRVGKGEKIGDVLVEWIRNLSEGATKTTRAR